MLTSHDPVSKQSISAYGAQEGEGCANAPVASVAVTGHSSTTMDSLHLLAMIALGLALGDSRLLEVDIGSVEHGRGAALNCPLLAPKVIELLGLDALARRLMELGKEIAAELGLSEAGCLQVRRDLLADLITRVKDSDRVCLLSHPAGPG